MWLIVKRGGETSFSLPLAVGRTIIGRGPSCQLTVQCRSLSRKHVELHFLDGAVTFSDLASRKGVFLNGKSSKEGELKPGDKLQLGEVLLSISPTLPEVIHKKEEEKSSPLCHLLKHVQESSDPRVLLEHLLQGLVEIFSAERGYVLLKKMGANKLTPVASYNIEDATSFAAVSSTVYKQAIESGEVLYIHNSREDERCAQAQSIKAHEWPRSIVCAPLSASGKTFGVLYVDRPMQVEEDTGDLLPTIDTAAGVAAQLLAGVRVRSQLLAERGRLKAINALAQQSERLVLGSSEQSQQLSQLLKSAAPEDVTVLITGETGTGKEMVARAIHEMSARAVGPFIAVNCAALPRDILEAELFGAEKGAYTGATERRLGRFELAQSGTLFLDEIGELPLDFQVTMLRALQERVITRLGGSKQIQVDFRLLCATNAGLEDAIQAGTFRRDFYYRINVFPVTLSPLRERHADIEELANHFLSSFTTRYNRKLKGFTKEAIMALKTHSWPGNIRELRNAIERAVVVERQELVQATSLPITDVALAGPEATFWSDLPDTYESAREMFERTFLERSLKIHDGNVTAVANKTGMPRRTIYRRLKAFGLLKDRHS